MEGSKYYATKVENVVKQINKELGDIRDSIVKDKKAIKRKIDNTEGINKQLAIIQENSKIRPVYKRKVRKVIKTVCQENNIDEDFILKVMCIRLDTHQSFLF